jgi:HEAT repeat protein
MQDDPGIHGIGVDGLCLGANAGSAEARADLARVTGDDDADVRRKVIECVAHGKDPGKNGVKVAVALIKDGDDGIRLQSAKVLALAARGGKVSNDVASALIQRLKDPNRDVRLTAMNALPALGADAVKAERERKDKGKTAEADPVGAAFEVGDEGEKLALLHATRELGSGELVLVAISDPSPVVRVAAVDLAVATKTRVAATMATALADADPQVRSAALQRIATGQDQLESADVEHALSLGIGDPDPELSQLALTTLARVADKDTVVVPRLKRALASRIESDRAKAAAAAIGLVERDAAKAIDLLTPLLKDPSRDVRAAMLPALGAAWASTNSPEQLAKLLRTSERDAMTRLTATAAFVILARTDGGRTAAESALGTVAKSGPPMAKRNATLALGLIGAGADGIGFLQQLVP